jgi:glutathionylspermidine synthase
VAGRPSGRAWADRLLLHWCQQSGPGEQTVGAREVLQIDPRLRTELAWLGPALDRLFRRWANGILAGDARLEDFRPPAFPLAKEIFAAGPLPTPFFWSRFDIFERADGGLAALEYNCDKPAGQREIWAAEALVPHRSNVNRGARSHFRRALAAAWAAHRRRFALAARTPRLAILADPAHREEFRLAYLFGREAAALGWTWDVVGPDNLVVDAGRPTAYGRPVDVVLRHYPAEYLYELPAAAALWTAATEGRVLWLNDPRAVVAQAKSAFAHLWVLAEDDRWLTRAEAALVRRALPPTGLASSPGWLDRARARPEDYVLKPVLGRYSEKVRVGALASVEEWQRGLDEAAVSPDDWVIQAYVPPRRRWLPDAGASGDGGRPGYVNWGVYLAAGRPAGICPRFQPTPLTEEGRVWWAPVVAQRTRPLPPTVLEPATAVMPTRGIGSAWRAIADRHALAGYTNVWTDGLANFTLAAVGVTPAAWDELAHANAVIGHAVGRVLAHLNGRPELAASLGIPGALPVLVTRVEAPHEWSFLSRLDWALTTDGQWKLMEINSDTPAGLWETGSIAPEVARLHGRVDALNAGFWPALSAAWHRLARSALGGDGRRFTIGMIGSPGAVEDQDQLRAHERAARRALPHATFERGSPEALVVRRGRAWLRGRPLDLLFRYYPLHWLAAPRFEPLLALVRAGRLPMLPAAHCLLPQSKAFLALLWELHDRGFFPPAEAAAIRRHVPRTALDPRQLGNAPFVVKPYLEHEGLGVVFPESLTISARRRIRHADVVYQERLELARVRLPVGTAGGWRVEERSLVFGVFLAGAQIAGVYTRAGGRITGREAVFVPMLLDDGRTSLPARRVAPRGPSGRLAAR